MTGLYLVADDLTGALDSAVAFCGCLGPIPVHLGAPHAFDGVHAAVDLATRDAHASIAIERTSRVAARLARADIAFKKIDSRLRGHWAVELATLMRSGVFACCVMAPAFPAQGRFTLKGRQMVRAVDGTLTAEPVDPLETIQALGLRALSVRAADAAAVFGALNATAATPAVLLFDASTDDDLMWIVEAVLQHQASLCPVLWCGAAGLSKALAPQPPPQVGRMPRPVLAVVGTDHPVSREQVALAIAAGMSHHTVRDGDSAEAIRAVVDAFGQGGDCLLTFDIDIGASAAQARAHIERRLHDLLPSIPRPASVVATGGETLLSICRAVSASHLEVDAQASPGVPHSRIRGGTWGGVEVLSKSGGFGAPNWLVELVAATNATDGVPRQGDHMSTSRRQVLGFLGAGAAGIALPSLGGCAGAAPRPADAGPQIMMDGHVHVTNRIYWEGIDAWTPTAQGWDFARARAAGVNCVIENIGTYGYWNYNYSPKQALRLMDTLLRFSETHSDKMAIALSPADARRIIASGRMAVFIGCESGLDHEGDSDVLEAFYRLGLRTIQFPTQSGFNAFSDSALAPVQGGEKPDHFGGINDRGRALVAQMNQLGILIDIAHGTEAVQKQLIAASKAPVVASHETMRSVSGAGLSDEVVKSLADKGGVIGIHGAAAVVGKRYRQWMAGNQAGAANAGSAVFRMVGFQPSGTRPPGDHGEYIERADREFRERWLALSQWKEDPSAMPFLPTADEWAEHVDYAIKLVGADHVGIGLDSVTGRSAVPATVGGYPDLLAALNHITTPANVRKITGENWLRVLGQSKVA
jgi:microsomal dipeptidase-like Zn-dependent dipeptidase/uncharacterized protein YgbK (DUF1537 family)